MNLRLLLLLLLLSGFSYTRAQDSGGYFEDRSFYGGLIAGMNAAQLDGDTYGGYHKVGLNVGGIVYAKFMQMAGISLELLFSQKGSKGVRTSESSVGSFYEKYTLGINYVEVPVMVHIFPPSKRVHFGAGASYSQYVNSKESYEGLYAMTFDPDLYRFKKYEVDVMLSISYMIYKGLMGDARFQYSVTPVRDGYYAPQGFSNAGKQMNNMFAFRLAYLF